MAKKKPKFYVVWQGRSPGVYRTWQECQAEINGFSGAKYKSFPTIGEANRAFGESASLHWGVAKSGGGEPKKKVTPKVDREDLAAMGVDMTAWAVDAACKGNPGELEYQGVDLATGTYLFEMGPYPEGTVNIGEFLAIVHALALLNPEQGGSDTQRQTAVYSDSQIGISWVKQKICKTKLPRTSQNRRLFGLVDRAQRWLMTHPYTNPVLKWQTRRWGEIPADFGRK